ncbi:MULTISPECIES: allophanate hydrolase subunit 1 [Methylobacterium]|uniref:Kinase A inhibitor n=1 Tax=Methylobacterium phyllosphaerae TaxID=418223 RepID=A0AAE8HVL2_9HYPH|nr:MULTISPECIES: allophanate hydrolase subunit 1 [Methylobacterium]APT32134.1 kinase A inhibitor [Methylobacterium phyllosphaerae]MBP32032.1 allophanate hydrolase subunit 1 [Methylobacterium sp.]MDE4912078.1 allophanate hydrolase subunit 1 [Methylobacterium sp. 092160098-2]RUP13118.1 MAG: allophanate hydrolase subunit 1 [Methylobacterium sp.]WFS05618.1 allophanate hydrolase subunit 1 [Methylobacterium sp. 391_Methyba4]
MSAVAEPRLLDAGEAALVVEFGSTVDPAISDRVLALDDALGADPPEGLRERVPTYRSLMLHYDPLVLDRATLAERVRALVSGATARASSPTLWTLPCCYASPHGEDIAQVAERSGLSPEAVVSTHSATTFRVYMYGFAPGFAYLGGLPEALAVPRRASPRPPHPRNAVMIGGGLAAVATVPMPTGWYVLGATPARLYAPERDPSFFVAAGDQIRFEPVDSATFDALTAREAAGEPVARRGEPH